MFWLFQQFSEIIERYANSKKSEEPNFLITLVIINHIREEDGKYDYLDRLDEFGEEFLKKYFLFNDNFQYLITERESPRDSYSASVENVIKKKTLVLNGEHTTLILVALLTAEKDRLIIIENPESHLHPKGQPNYENYLL